MDAFTLGLHLGLKQAKLYEIEKNHQGDMVRQRQEVIAVWLNGHPAASWHILAQALEEMGHLTLAQTIRRKFVPGEI